MSMRYIGVGAMMGGGGGGEPAFIIITSHVLPATPNTVQAPPSDSRDELLAYLSVSGEESFEVTPQDLAGYVGSANGIDATFTVDPLNVLCEISATNFDGLFATDGTRHARIVSSDEGDDLNITITFSTPVASWWTYFTDIGDYDGGLTITLNKTGGGTQGPYTVEPSSNVGAGYLTFWGFVDTGLNTYDSLTILISNPADVVAMDQMGMATFAQLA